MSRIHQEGYNKGRECATSLCRFTNPEEQSLGFVFPPYNNSVTQKSSEQTEPTLVN